MDFNILFHTCYDNYFIRWKCVQTFITMMIRHALLGRICHVHLIIKIKMQVVITKELIVSRGIICVDGRGLELSRNVEK